MSVAAEVVRGVLCVVVLAGGVVLLRYSWFFVRSWWELVEPVVVAVRLWVGTVAMFVGLWCLRLGGWVAAVQIKLVFPEVREFEKYLTGREEVRL